jgi:hypothetical protein
MAFTELVARFSSRQEGELAKGYLDDAGVESILTVDDAGGNLGLTLDNSAALFVRATDSVQAREVLRDAGVLEEGENGAAP